MAVGPSLPFYIRWPTWPVTRCGITGARHFVSPGVPVPEAAQELGKEGNIWSFCVHSSKDRSLFLQGRGVWCHQPPIRWLTVSLKDDAHIEDSCWPLQAGWASVSASDCHPGQRRPSCQAAAWPFCAPSVSRTQCARGPTAHTLEGLGRGGLPPTGQALPSTWLLTASVERDSMHEREL